MNNKVYFGLSNLHIAFLGDSTNLPQNLQGLPVWENPVNIPGAVKFSPNASTEENTFYADNMLYFISNQSTGYTANLEVAAFPEKVLAEMLGWEHDDMGALVEVANGKPKQFAILAQLDGDVKNRRIVFYNCTGSTPSREYSTNEKGIKVTTENMAITISPIDLGLDLGGGNMMITKAHMEYSPGLQGDCYNNFFKQVYMPTFSGLNP